MDDDLDYRIRFRAYELWAQSGKPNASSIVFWEEARAALDLERNDVGKADASGGNVKTSSTEPISARQNDE